MPGPRWNGFEADAISPELFQSYTPPRDLSPGIRRDERNYLSGPLRRSRGLAHAVDRRAERLAPLLEVGELVERGAGGREQDDGFLARRRGVGIGGRDGRLDVAAL